MKKRKNSTSKKSKAYSTNEVKRYFGALQEHTDDRFKAIAENFPDVHRKLDEHGGVLLRHKHILETHTHMIGTVMGGIETIKESLDIMRGDLKQKVGQDEFSALTCQVLVLEKRV